mmetsp:Transcript_22401/g.62113  ORF Transcript_22401/g.62113 Transcript_22401/m.62113 type:complete len:385 (-) Transcript_22401:297-1451(-)
MDNGAAALRVAEKLQAKPAPEVSALQKPGDVGKHSCLKVELTDSKVGGEGGERVVCDLGSCRGDHAEQCALPGARDADNPDVCHQLELQLQPALLALLAGLTNHRAVVHVGLEAGVSPPAFASRRKQCLLPIMDEFRHGKVTLLSVFEVDDGAWWHTDLEVVAARPGGVVACPRRSISCPEVNTAAECLQGADRGVSHGPYVATSPSISAPRAALRHKLLSPESHTAVAAITGLDKYSGSVKGSDLHRKPLSPRPVRLLLVLVPVIVPVLVKVLIPGFIRCRSLCRLSGFSLPFLRALPSAGLLDDLGGGVILRLRLLVHPVKIPLAELPIQWDRLGGILLRHWQPRTHLHGLCQTQAVAASWVMVQGSPRPSPGPVRSKPTSL